MRRLRLGDALVQIDAPGAGGLDEFLDRISDYDARGAVTHRMAVRCGNQPRLVLDDHGRTITLSLPAGSCDPTVRIGVLQALVRGLAYLQRSTRHLALLHGSALTAGDAAVAVLDGGLGQGKTSLALGLARRHGRLLVDEFAFARTRPGRVVLSAAPTLPWHVRVDMAPYVTPTSVPEPLLHGQQLRAVAGTSTREAPLRLILVPDRSTAPGLTIPVEPDHVAHLLRHAVADHLNKLANPRLDHVSIFTTTGQITDGSGQALAGRDIDTTGRDTVLHMLVAIPTYRVGIGAPADLPRSVVAAGHLIETIPE